MMFIALIPAEVFAAASERMRLNAARMCLMG